MFFISFTHDSSMSQNVMHERVQFFDWDSDSIVIVIPQID